MAEVIKTTFQLRRGYEAAWKRNNPILASGEPGFVLDRNLLKVGDGITPWNDLDYINVQAGVFAAEKVEDFPAEGSSDKLYKASSEKKLYQWNEETKTYEPLGGSELSPEQIERIELVLKEFETLSTEVQTITDEIETITKELETLSKEVVRQKYEVFSKPEGTLVSVKENEIRIMCPKDTDWQLQNSGEGADPNKYYVGLKIYAPNNEINSFKEDLAEIISDDTMYYFENNEFAGVDENGRKFSIVWLPVALYNGETQSWTYYGEKSSTKKYSGWYYTVEWYDSNSKLVDSYSIRINLSNEECHSNIEPYFMSSINVNKLSQNEGEYLVLYGGSATDNI